MKGTSNGAMRTPGGSRRRASKSVCSPAGDPNHKTLQRATFRTSRLLDFSSEKELVAQTGHRREVWPLVILKELVDNSIDACEEAGIAPEIIVTVDRSGITVADNGPGLPAKTIKGVIDFSVRVSSREAYVSPTRGAQGNALKTLVAMPFVLHGERVASKSRPAAADTSSTSAWTVFGRNRSSPLRRKPPM